MRPVDIIAARSMLLFILCGIDFCFLLGGYGILRVLRLSVDWVTWLMGGGIILLSLVICIEIVLPGMTPRWLDAAGKLVGACAFLVAVYAASQWATRQWYLQVKKSASKRVIQSSKQVLVFLRTHHQFFGWIVAMGAIGHMVFFFPLLSRVSGYEEITGFVAIGILALLVLLGLWLWAQMTLLKRRMPKVVHTIHAGLAIAFFVALFLHI